MMVFIVPRITESFAKAGSDLPALTQKVVNISNFFIHDYMTII
jgi:type II secretory pathway component PulF